MAPKGNSRLETDDRTETRRESELLRGSVRISQRPHSRRGDESRLRGAVHGLRPTDHDAHAIELGRPLFDGREQAEGVLRRGRRDCDDRCWTVGRGSGAIKFADAAGRWRDDQDRATAH